jgi:hypothetical protein
MIPQPETKPEVVIPGLTTEEIRQRVAELNRLDHPAPEAPWWASLEGLPSLMKALAEARRESEQVAERVAEMERFYQQTPEYRMYQGGKQALAEAKARAEALDAAARKQALDDFKASGEKAVYAGVSVKFFSRYDYDASQMTDWARVNMPRLLMLDTKRMEKAAAAGVLEDAPIVITKEPRVQIATDLSAYLAEVTP